MKQTIISLYDKTGNILKPWAMAGFRCIAIDIQHSISKVKTVDGIEYHYGDARTWTPPDDCNLSALFASPPCDHVCSSGARWFLAKGTAMLRDALEHFSVCVHAAKWAGVPYMIENSVGKFSDHMGKPDHYFDPWEFSVEDNYTKKTCLWTGNGFIMPEPLVLVKPNDVTDMIHKMAPSKDRSDMRSVTPMGFANAVYQANKGVLS